MREWPAIGVATLVAPLVPGISMGLVLTVSDPKDWLLGLTMPLICYQLSLMTTAVVGLPLFLVLRQLNWLRWWVALLTGCPLGFGIGHFPFCALRVALDTGATRGDWFSDERGVLAALAQADHALHPHGAG
jgi:hypothetical protein